MYLTPFSAPYIDETGEFAFLAAVPAIATAGAAVISSALYYAPQIMSFGQSLTTTFGQITTVDVLDNARQGNYGMVMFGTIASGEMSAGKAVSTLAKNRIAGALGEKAAEIVKNTEKIPSMTKPGTSRIPDILDHSAKVIGDVKNVNYQSFTSQLRDFADYAQKNSYKFVLNVDNRTRVSQTLQQIGQKIEVIRKDLNNLKK